MVSVTRLGTSRCWNHSTSSRRVGQAGLDEAVVERLLVVELVPVLHQARADAEDVVRLDRRRPAPRPRPQVGVVERLALVEPVLAAVAGHVDQHAAPDDALLGDRQHARPCPSRRWWCGRRSRSRAGRRTRRGRARRTAWSPAGNPRCRRRSAGRRGTGARRRRPRSTRRAPSSSPSRARPGHSGSPGPSVRPIWIWRVNTSPVRMCCAPRSTSFGVEVVQRADLVVGAPLAPVLRRVGTQKLVHGGGVGHEGNSSSSATVA